MSFFVIPSDNHWIVGTTDSDWSLDRAHPAATHRDITYLITTLNEVLTDPLTADDVVGVYVGLRPLLAGDSDKTSKLSREHAVTSSTGGLVSIAGGKYTTYRVMAADTIDMVGIDQGLDLPKSSTDQVPLLGSEGYVQLRAQISEIAETWGVLPATVDHLLSRQGIESTRFGFNQGRCVAGRANRIRACLTCVLKWFTPFDSKQRYILKMY